MRDVRRLELAVIHAAYEDHRGGCAPESCGGSRLDPCRLANALQALTLGCPECNTGDHTCPGDGNSIKHGDTDCGQHANVVHPDGTIENRAIPRCAGCGELFDGRRCWYCDDKPVSPPLAAEAELIWHPRTWVDVRPGDTVRLPGGEVTAEIGSAVLHHWNVDPRTGTSAYNPPVAMPHDVMRVRFAHELDASPRDLDPAKPVEIQLTRSEVEALDAAGWTNRARLDVTREGAGS